LRGEETDAGDGFDFELGARLLEPVDDEVGFGFDAAFVQIEEVVDVLVAEFAAEELAAEEGWIADDVVGCGPGGFVGLVVGVVAEDGVGVFDVGESLRLKLMGECRSFMTNWRNVRFGSRPTESAKRQKTRRMRKCAISSFEGRSGAAARSSSMR
jgi:hypothetical protein